ncbi:hypothetical protein H0H81_003601 [Sphagnurus paluster]|uniref:Programmed cell death protein 2 C-terminal domain-containing protein n=1 Tax=Sphagnurus paluster TaxID=117069 RepID=A0A9P7FUV3_9AGAR|nr:hypothetical protein H0H81_003601 [Sphagnurus paluster]
MGIPQDDDWSDSDDELISEVETSVLLGVPDGAVQSISDITDAAVSRIGGHPAFLPSLEPSLSSSQCKICSNPSELLVQIWCPFEDSPMDRAMYIWGCAKASCQGKHGSIRAWRGLRRNDKYAAKLEKKLAKKRAAEEAQARARSQAQVKKTAPKINPFAVCCPHIPVDVGLLKIIKQMSTASTPSMFGGGFGAQIFGDLPPDAPEETVKPNNNDDKDAENDEDEEDATSEDELLTAIASVTVEESPWKAAPSYPPIYLSTVSEYLPAPPKSKVSPKVQIDDGLDDDNDGKGAKDVSWMSEAYEDSLELDHVFERFTKRVSYESEQCVRRVYPHSYKIFTSLYPSPPAPALPITKAAFTVVHTQKRRYFPTGIPPCPVCKGKRVFECQLMPNLINVLRHPEDKPPSDEEHRKAVEQMLKCGTVPDATRGMEWGTCMVFSCEKDCCMEVDGSKPARECWREEIVLVQAAI